MERLVLSLHKDTKRGSTAACDSCKGAVILKATMDLNTYVMDFNILLKLISRSVLKGKIMLTSITCTHNGGS